MSAKLKYKNVHQSHIILRNLRLDAKSVDPDKAAHDEPPQLHLRILTNEPPRRGLPSVQI